MHLFHHWGNFRGKVNTRELIIELNSQNTEASLDVTWFRVHSLGRPPTATSSSFRKLPSVYLSKYASFIYFFIFLVDNMTDVGDIKGQDSWRKESPQISWETSSARTKSTTQATAGLSTMLFKSIIASALFALSLPVHGSQTFSNTGTLSGWDSKNEEHKGTMQQVTNVVYNGSTALKATQVYDSSYTGRYHSEVVRNNVYKRGDTGFYGFAFRLQDDWQFSPAQSYNLAQFIADFSDTGCDDYMPASMVWLVGDKLHTRVKQGTICQQKTTEFTETATVSAGVWHRVEIQASWKTDGTGFYKLWFDGNNILEHDNIDTTIEDDRAFQFRVGLYANGWHDDNGMKGSQGTRQVWYDQIATGTEFADADPAAW